MWISHDTFIAMVFSYCNRCLVLLRPLKVKVFTGSTIQYNTNCIVLYPSLTLFSGFSPRVPPKMKRGIFEENEHEQPAGNAAMKLVEREIMMPL